MAKDVGNGHVVVVGVDASAESKLALRWALRQAELTGATLRAVTAWNVPSGYDVELGLPEGLDLTGAAEKGLAAAVEEAGAAKAAVPVQTMVVRGHAADVLLDHSKDADVLVVGSRGRGGFARALLGSVSQHCVHHAGCPVVVVRSPKTAHHRS